MSRRLGAVIVGVGGAVASTAAVGVESIRAGRGTLDGLPLARRDIAGAVSYEDLYLAGWDVNAQDVASAVRRHGVVEREMLTAVENAVRGVEVWPALVDRRFCANIDGLNRIKANSHRAAVDLIRRDIDRFADKQQLDAVVVMNLGSSERPPDLDRRCFRSLADFERGVDEGDPEISPAMLYAYAAIADGLPYANFTPSVAADIAPLEELAEKKRVPLAGKDGKTGQTLLKTVVAPMLRDRALRVDGWYSTNILGNLDGLALDDDGSRSSKIKTKRNVLDSILGYEVADHIVDIRYHPPKGDNKEAWDSIDLSGFLGRKMQLKLNFLCADSILAAPLVIEIVRLLDLAKQRGETGPQAQLGVFFKMPQTGREGPVEHEFAAQQARLEAWIDSAAP